MDASNVHRARDRMVKEQLIRRGITDRAVLDAMGSIPRERFVPPRLAEEAYADRPLPIGEGQTISQPYIVAAMIESLGPLGDARVLDVGAGSGYTTAILATLAKDVVAIERHRALADEARARLAALGVSNATFVVGDGTLGAEEHAPYDAILVSAAGPRIPDALVTQLARGGTLIVPVGDRESQELVRVRRDASGAIHEDTLGGVRFVPLVGAGAFPSDD
jgi:protein-L-isoaspartate(D-aspartate) O-methyltransferase